MRRRGHNRARGQALVESAASMVLLIPLFIGFFALLWNAGLLMYNQQRLSFLCYQTALFAGALGNNPSTSSMAGSYATSVGKALGLKLTKVSIGAAATSLSMAGYPAPIPEYTVTISATSPLAFGIFGNSLTINDSITLPPLMSDFNRYNCFMQVNTYSDVEQTVTGVFMIPAWFEPSLTAIPPNSLPISLDNSSVGVLDLQCAVATPSGGMTGVFAGYPSSQGPLSQNTIINGN